jgi:Flp pilus assembly protein TadG
MIGKLKSWLVDERGASAAEFALLLTPMVLLLFGIVHLCLLVYSAMQLNYAAEATARCMVTSVNLANSSAICDDSSSSTTLATSYFNSLYHGITATPTLALDEAPTCTSSTYQVVATANYKINAFFLTRTVPLTAKACFPHS